MATILETQNLKKYFKSGAGMVHAVDDISFSIEKGETVGLVGESGCGKSTLGRTLIHLNESTDGKILFDGKDITKLSNREMTDFRKNVQMIFSHINKQPFHSMEKAGFVDRIGRDNFCKHIDDALKRAVILTQNEKKN